MGLLKIALFAYGCVLMFLAIHNAVEGSYLLAFIYFASAVWAAWEERSLA